MYLTPKISARPTSSTTAAINIALRRDVDLTSTGIGYLLNTSNATTARIPSATST